MPTIFPFTRTSWSLDMCALILVHSQMSKLSLSLTHVRWQNTDTDKYTCTMTIYGHWKIYMHHDKTRTLTNIHAPWQNTDTDTDKCTCNVTKRGRLHIYTHDDTHGRSYPHAHGQFFVVVRLELPPTDSLSDRPVLRRTLPRKSPSRSFEDRSHNLRCGNSSRFRRPKRRKVSSFHLSVRMTYSRASL